MLHCHSQKFRAATRKVSSRNIAAGGNLRHHLMMCNPMYQARPRLLGQASTLVGTSALPPVSPRVAPLAYLPVQRNAEGSLIAVVAVPPSLVRVLVYTVLASLPMATLTLPSVVWSSSLHWLRGSSPVIPDFVGFVATPLLSFVALSPAVLRILPLL